MSIIWESHIIIFHNFIYKWLLLFMECLLHDICCNWKPKNIQNFCLRKKKILGYYYLIKGSKLIYTVHMSGNLSWWKALDLELTVLNFCLFSLLWHPGKIPGLCTKYISSKMSMVYSSLVFLSKVSMTLWFKRKMIGTLNS